jgi:hypothetical protein
MDLGGQPAIKSAALPDPSNTNTGTPLFIDDHTVFIEFIPPSTMIITTGTFTPVR